MTQYLSGYQDPGMMVAVNDAWRHGDMHNAEGVNWWRRTASSAYTSTWPESESPYVAGMCCGSAGFANPDNACVCASGGFTAPFFSLGTVGDKRLMAEYYKPYEPGMPQPTAASRYLVAQRSMLAPGSAYYNPIDQASNVPMLNQLPLPSCSM